MGIGVAASPRSYPLRPPRTRRGENGFACHGVRTAGRGRIHALTVVGESAGWPAHFFCDAEDNCSGSGTGARRGTGVFSAQTGIAGSRAEESAREMVQAIKR